MKDAALGMYRARAEAEQPMQPALYARNPENLQFYFKGVEDVLITIETLVQDGCDPMTIGVVLQSLRDSCKQNNDRMQ